MTTNPDMSPAHWMNDPKRGAAMGRPSNVPEAPKPMKVALQTVRLNSGGYDSGGAYWGHYQRLYWAGSECGELDVFFRADSRDAAKEHVRGLVPGARFYR